MPVILLYLLKVSVGLAAVFLFYQLVLRRLTFYNWNRWYLLGYTLLCFFVPFINISPVLEQQAWADSRIIRWVPVIRPSSASGSVATDSPSPSSLAELVSTLLILGMLIMLIRLLIQFISFLHMRRKASFISGDGMKLYQVNDTIIPFSFGNAVFINKDLHTEAELQEIIRHEFVHVRQRHSLDMLWAELLCLFSWFNPFAWLLRKAIRQNLEFIADNKVLENGIDPKEYQYLLLKVTGNNQYSIATPFNFSSLKKRIAMMNKLQSAKVHLLRFLFVLPLLAVILVSFREEIGDSLTRHKVPALALTPGDLTDTLPPSKEVNSKGYFIDVQKKDGHSVVLVKDKDRKEVKQILLSEWMDKQDHYENLYGKFPPPPPPLPPAPPEAPGLTVSIPPGAPLATPLPSLNELGVPAPPLPPQPVKLPDNVEKIDVNNNKAKVLLKNGKTETYDLDKPAEKKQFESRYGKMIPTPPPGATVSFYPGDVVALATPLADINGNEMNLARVSNEYEITDKKAVIKLKNGTVEKYDLTNKTERKKFEEKYGKIIHVNGNINSAAPVAGTVNGNVNVTAAPAVIVSRGTSTTVAAPASLSATPLASTVVAPARVISGGIGTTTIAPMASGEDVVVADDYGYIITGKEDIVVVITKNTTRKELEENIKNMKKLDIDLSYDNIEYNSKGELIAISGTMRSDDGRSNFVANDFNTLILAMIRKGEKTYFKVSTTERKQVN